MLVTRFGAIAALLLVSTSPYAQEVSLKLIDHASLFKEAGVRSYKIEHIEFANDEVQDTCLIAEVRLDNLGRPQEVTNYFACGRKFSVDLLRYDPDGKVDTLLLSCRQNQWDTTAVSLRYDEKGRVIERSFRNMRETYTYADDGSMIACHIQRQQDGNWLPVEQKSFKAKAEDAAQRAENNLTYIYDLQGLLLIHNIYAEDGSLRRIRKYTYSFEAVADTAP